LHNSLSCVSDTSCCTIKTEQQMEVLAVEYQIKYAGGHVEVYDRNGKFLFSADTVTEALAELQTLEAA